MICSGFLRSVSIQAGIIKTLFRRNIWFKSVARVSHDYLGHTYPLNCKLRQFRLSVNMMVDTGANENKYSVVDVLPKKADNGAYSSGGCISEDGKLSCGYSSFQGMRASMEDFYDVKVSNIDGKTICLFGIFDEKDTFRDDGSTAATDILMGNHLYVANVADS